MELDAKWNFKTNLLNTFFGILNTFTARLASKFAKIVQIWAHIFLAKIKYGYQKKQNLTLISNSVSGILYEIDS
jgi:hypothetical protein